MRRIQQFYFGLGVGNAILAPIGFIGPGPDWPGVFAAALSVGAFIVLGVVTHIDDKARAEFLRLLASFRMACVDTPDVIAKISELEERVITHKSIVELSHDIGMLHGQLVERGLIPKEKVQAPQSEL